MNYLVIDLLIQFCDNLTLFKLSQVNKLCRAKCEIPLSARKVIASKYPFTADEYRILSDKIAITPMFTEMNQKFRLVENSIYPDRMNHTRNKLSIDFRMKNECPYIVITGKADDDKLTWMIRVSRDNLLEMTLACKSSLSVLHRNQDAIQITEYYTEYAEYSNTYLNIQLIDKSINQLEYSNVKNNTHIYQYDKKLSRYDVYARSPDEGYVPIKHQYFNNTNNALV